MSLRNCAIGPVRSEGNQLSSADRGSRATLPLFEYASHTATQFADEHRLVDAGTGHAACRKVRSACSNSRAAKCPFARCGNRSDILGMPLATYTAVLLTHSTVPVWVATRQSLPFLFVASSVASLASAFELMPLGRSERVVVRRFGVMGRAADVIASRVVEHHACSNPHIGAPLKRGFSATLWKSAEALTATSLLLSIWPEKAVSADAPREFWASPADWRCAPPSFMPAKNRHATRLQHSRSKRQDGTAMAAASRVIGIDLRLQRQ
jgi:hypothetical protein